MALPYIFKPGAGQASEASEYFTSIANEWADQALVSMVAKQLVIQEPDRGKLKLRIWSYTEGDVQLIELVPWLRRVIRKMADIAKPGSDPMRHIPLLLSCPRSTVNCFIEILGRASFTPNEQNLFTIGIRNGRTILLSSPQVMLVELDEDLIGLTILERGSWQIDTSEKHFDHVEVSDR